MAAELQSTVDLRQVGVVVQQLNNSRSRAAISAVAGSMSSLQPITEEILIQEREAHENACESLLGLKRMLEIRQQNTQAFSELDNKQFARLFIGGFAVGLFFSPVYTTLLNMKTTVYMQVVAPARNTGHVGEAVVKIIAGVFASLIQACYLPLLLLPRILVGALLLCVYPVAAAVLASWLFILAERNTAVLSTLLTANVCAPIYIWVLSNIQFGTTTERSPSVTSSSRHMSISTLSALIRTQEAAELATQLQLSYQSSQIMTAPGGFMTENPRFLQELLQGKRKRDPDDFVINMYASPILSPASLPWIYSSQIACAGTHGERSRSFLWCGMQWWA